MKEYILDVFYSHQKISRKLCGLIYPELTKDTINFYFRTLEKDGYIRRVQGERGQYNLIKRPETSPRLNLFNRYWRGCRV